MKIVSLLPSATELVCGLGLRDQLVGCPTNAIIQCRSWACPYSQAHEFLKV